MSIIDDKANESVGRAFSFSALAIGCVGMGLSYEPIMAAKTVAILSTLLSLTMMGFGERAPYRSVRRTETWTLLESNERPAAEAAQRIVGAALRLAFLRHARIAAILAIGFWAAALLLQIL